VTPAYTAKRLRPLARRAANTARPPRVLERTKKPWVRLRLVTEGWKVRFMVIPKNKFEFQTRNYNLISPFCQSLRTARWVWGA
jgi:hypothetical protein